MIEHIDFAPSGREPRAELQQFLGNVRELLGVLVRRENSSLFHSEAHGLFAEAWPEIADRFGDYATMVGASDPAVLAHHGLIGEQLRFKLEAVNLIGRRFFEHVADGPTLIARIFLTKLLGIIDKVLRSLVAAVPGGGAIEEFKDILESLVDDSSAEARV